VIELPGRLWLMTEATAGDVVEWIAESYPGQSAFSSYQIQADYYAGDLDTAFLPFATNWGVFIEDSDTAFFPFLFGTAVIAASDIDGRWRRQQDGTLIRARQELFGAQEFRGASVLWQSWLSEDLEGEAWAILYPVQGLEHPLPEFSTLGLAPALGRLQHGPEVIPLQLTKLAGAPDLTGTRSAA
jgi:hypothetical protein